MDDNREIINSHRKVLKAQYPTVNIDKLLVGIYNDKPTDFYKGLEAKILTVEDFKTYVTDCAAKIKKINAKFSVFNGEISREEFNELYPNE